MSKPPMRDLIWAAAYAVAYAVAYIDATRESTDGPIWLSQRQRFETAESCADDAVAAFDTYHGDSDDD